MIFNNKYFKMILFDKNEDTIFAKSRYIIYNIIDLQ